MSRQISEDAIAQILQDISDSESEDIRDKRLFYKEEPLPSSDEAGPSAPKMKRRCSICPRSKDKRALLFVDHAKKLFVSLIQ